MKRFALFCLVLGFCNAVFTFSDLNHVDGPADQEKNCKIDGNKNFEDSINDCEACIEAATDACVDFHEKCFTTDDCLEWLRCTKICSYSFDLDECNEGCDDDFYEDDVVLADLKLCLCDICMSECYGVCGE